MQRLFYPREVLLAEGGSFSGVGDTCVGAGGQVSLEQNLEYGLDFGIDLAQVVGGGGVVEEVL